MLAREIGSNFVQKRGIVLNIYDVEKLLADSRKLSALNAKL